MVGLDTNVLVRYFVNDNQAQHDLARMLVNNNDIYLSNIVLLESYWVLKRLVKLDHKQVHQCMYCLLQMSNASFENCAAFAGALHLYKTKGCDFADGFIYRLHQLVGIETVSFDQRALSKLGFIHPQQWLS